MKPKVETRRSLWKNAAGTVRLGWLLLLGAAAYWLVLYGFVNGFGWLFGRLFDAWGLTDANLTYAPRWAQYVVARHADFVYAVVYGVSTIFFWKLGKKLNGRTTSVELLPRFFGALSGLALGALLTVLAILPDSVRMERPLTEPVLHFQQLIALALLTLGWINAEVLSKRFAFDCTRKRCGRGLAYLVGTVAGMMIFGTWTGIAGILNSALIALLGCVLYERGGLWASVGFGIARNAWCMLVFRFPGVSGSAEPVYALYHVSDAWLTGGTMGPMHGLWMTACCAALLAGLNFNGIRNTFNDITRRRSTNGKDSHCNRRSGLER